MIGVVPNLGGEIEGHRETRLTLSQEEAVALVRLVGRCVSRVLAQGPKAAPVHRGLHAARKGVFSWEAELLQIG